jgi:hypothetical protein
VSVDVSGMRDDAPSLITILLLSSQQTLIPILDIDIMKHTKPCEKCQQNANMAFGVFNIFIIMLGTGDNKAGLIYRFEFILSHTIKSDFFASAVLTTRLSN